MNESRCVTPIIGQEAICPDGLGRVVAYNFDNPYDFIQVQTYINDRSCKWDAKNVQLIDPFSGNKPKVASDPETERLLDDIFNCGEDPDKIREILVTAGVLSK